MACLGTLRAFLACAFVAAGLLGSGGAAQAFNCPPQSITVPSGGTVITDLSSCSLTGFYDYGTRPLHGPYDNRNTQFDTSVYYVNNGDGATSDSFSVQDADDLSFVPFTVTIVPAGPSVTTPALPGGTVGVAYSLNLAANGGTSPYTWSLAGGALPAGMTLSSSGFLSGSPTAAGSFNPVFAVTDSANRTATRALGWNIAAPTIFVSPASLPGAMRGQAYSQSLSASGGTAPYSFSVTAGALPSGLTLSSSGILSGTATSAGSYTFTVNAVDASTGTGAPYSGSRSYTLNVAVPAIALSPTTLSDATVGQAYNQTLAASGGTAPYTYAVTAGALPAGLSLGGGSTLSGTATVAGTFVLTVTATDAFGNTGSRGYTISVVAPSITLAPGSLPNTTAGTAYSQSLTATGGTAPYSFAVTAGALPTGLTLSSGGTLVGTATSAGTFNFIVSATDGNGNTGSRGYSISVGAPSITLAPGTLPGSTAGLPYSQSLSASGGSAPYTFAVTAGALPAGLTLDSSGTLSGTATVPGTSNFNVTATDANGSSGSAIYTVTVAAPTVTVAPAALPDATVGQAYSQTVTASGGSAPYTFTVTAGALPSGLTLSSSGVLAGTATAAGSLTFTVTTTDANGFTGVRTYTLDAVLAPPIASNVTLGVAANSSANAVPLTLSGGAATSVQVAAQAANGTATASGIAISYTPNPGFAGADSFTYTATNASGTSAPATVSVTVAPATDANLAGLVPSVGTLSPVFTPGTNAYAVAVPNAQATIELTPTVADPGATVTVNGTPVASGSVSSAIPLAVGATSLPVVVTAQNGSTNTYTVTVTRAASSVATLANLVPSAGSLNAAFASGTASYTLALPAGQTSISFTPTLSDAGATVSVNGAAVASGGASSAIAVPVGTTTVSVVVTAADGSSTQTYTVAVTRTASADASLASLGVSTGVLSPAFAPGTTNYAVSVPNEVATLRLSPSPTDASATVTVNGAPIAPVALAVGTNTLTVLVTAADGTTTRSYVVTVTRAGSSIALSPAAGPLPDIGVGLPYSLVLTPSGGTAPYAFALTSGSLPAGLALDPTRGTIAGTPTAAGEANFTIAVTDASGAIGTSAYRLVVKAAPVVAVSRSETIEAGSTTTVDLTAGATGGPFTDARLVSLVPPNAGTAVIILGETAAADDASFAEVIKERRYTLKFTPDPSFAGRAVATYTLSNAVGTSAPATIAFLVAPRADPSRDSEVLGLLTAQVDAARRFAKDQTRNFNNRLEQLHDEGDRRHSSMDVRLGYQPDEEPQGVGQQSVDALRRLDAEQARRMNEALPGLLSGYGPEDGKGPRPRSRLDAVAGDPRDPKAAARGTSEPSTPVVNLGRFAVWSGGYVNFGDRDKAGLDFDYTTVGVSGGIDYRFSPGLVAGFGVGYGRDATDVGDRGTESRGNSYSAAVYGSWTPLEGLYLDGLLGGSRLDFDSLRFVTGEGALAAGTREGRQVFGSLTASYERRRDNWLLSPYGRVEVARSWLDEFTEAGPSALNLTYGEQSVDTVAGVLGVRGSYSVDMDWGVLKPGFRAEYTHDFAGDSEVALGYADIGASPYTVRTDASEQDYVTLGLSLDADFASRWSAGLDYRTSFGRETQNHAFGLKVGTRF
ncbi:putative Ig domain-containing protein [Aureimonas phyllosphaerae]|uniref:putative Ig domain-containing protein n=1 Tax=Aureimonas phyllosphaerae TaxID=1166078 RepID=UPI003A5BD025